MEQAHRITSRVLDILLCSFALFCVPRTNSSPRPAVRGDRFRRMEAAGSSLVGSIPAVPPSWGPKAL